MNPFRPLPAILLVAAPSAQATSLPTQQEALGLAFPGSTSTRREHFLSEDQARRVKEQAGVALAGVWVVAYEARRDGKLVGVAFFDTHRVRTLNETAMVAVDASGKVQRVEVVAFREPQEYMAKEGWKKQLEGRRLDGELKLNRAIRPLSGATLTAHALTDAARRSLALWQVLYAAAP